MNAHNFPSTLVESSPHSSSIKQTSKTSADFIHSRAYPYSSEFALFFFYQSPFHITHMASNLRHVILTESQPTQSANKARRTTRHLGISFLLVNSSQHFPTLSFQRIQPNFYPLENFTPGIYHFFFLSTLFFRTRHFF